MTPEEARRFLGEGTRTGTLATERAGGRPHVAAVWFVFDGDDLFFSTWHATVKTANRRRDRRVAIAVDDEALPFAFVLVEGVATIDDEATVVRV